MSRGVTVVSAALALGAALSQAAGAQQPQGALARGAERVLGVVRDSAGQAVGNATVIVTRGPDRLVRQALTDSLGRFEFVFDPGTGDYLVYATALPGGAARRRVRQGDAGIGSPLTLVLRSAPTVLRPVVAAATRPRPPRNQTTQEDPGSSSQLVDGLGGWIQDVHPGDLSAQIAMIPGVLADGEQLSVLGTGSQEHQTTLNGAAVQVGTLPGLAKARLRVSPGAVDPAQGGFSGAQVAIELSPGSNLANREFAITASPPSPFGTGAANAFTQRKPAEAFLASVGADGALAYDRLFYNVAAQASLSRRGAFLDARNGSGTEGLQQVNEALRTVRQLPVSAVANRDFDLSAVTRIDRTPRGKHAASLTSIVQFRRGLSSGDELTAGGRALQNTSYSAAMVAGHSSYLGSGVLTEFRAAIDLSSDESAPQVLMPEGRVRLDADVDAGSQGVLLFGGRAGGNSLRRRGSAELTNETTRYFRGTSHRTKLAAGVRSEADRFESNANLFGTYYYQSLSDLTANRPSSFTRSGAGLRGTHSGTSAFLALSDHWRLRPTFRLLYGARLDWLDVERSPGLHSGLAAVPEVSPRIGFTWVYRTPQRPEPPVRGGSMGTFASRPHGTLRASVGRFVSRPSAEPALQAAAYAKGPVSQFRCVGPGTLAPSWDPSLAGREVPRADCAAEAMVDTGDVSYTIGDRLAGSRSWRGTLGWAGAVGRFAVGVDAVGSATSRMLAIMPEWIPGEAAFRSRPDGRRVFVPESAIDGASGLLIRRVSPASRFEEPGSARAGQVTLSIAPLVPNVSRRHWSLAYTAARSDVRAFGIGFPGVEGSPRGERAPAPNDVRHVVLGQAGFAMRRGYSFVVIARAQSGRPFTPVIAGDVDGDGVAWDRAFVPRDLAGASDALTRAVADAYAHSSDAGRGCLRKLRGTTAGINSCRGSWSYNATLILHTPGGIHPALRLGDRVRASAYLENVVSLVDHAVHHGSLRGWGTGSQVDPVLLRVSGFDPTRQAFRFQSNQAFGRPRATVAGQYRFGLTVSVDLSEPSNAQSLRRFLSPGRGHNPGPRLPADTIASRFSRMVTDMYQVVLEQGDSLFLVPAQVAELQRGQEKYRRQVDSLWAALGQDLAALGDRFDAARALARTDSVTDEAWWVTQQHAHAIYTLLDPMQRTLVPRLLQTLATSDQPVRVRVTSAW